MAQPSLIIGDNNWAVKETSLLGYNVIQNKYLPIPIDTVRATTATRVNSAGLIEVVPRNLLRQSNSFDTTWILSGTGTVTTGATDPFGGSTAWTLAKTAANTFLYQSTAGITGSATFSIYAKEGTVDQVWINHAQSGAFSAFFDLTLGTTFGSAGCVATIVSVGGGWFRCSIAGTVTSPINLRIYPASSNSTGGTTGTILIYGAQAETSTTATEYFPTTTRLNIPRIDYTNGSCPSILVEPQRTNLYTYSEQLNQWGKIGTFTVTENDSISPDGTQNADRVQFASSGDVLFRSGTGSVGSNTISVYAKAKNGVSANFRFFANGNTLLSSNQVATGEWQRFTFTYTYSAATTGLAAPTTGASDVLFYGFQHEVSSYATSYIPTVASTVTRNADLISKTGISDLIGQTEGTVFIEFKDDGEASSFTNYLRIDDGTTNNNISVYKNNSLSSLGAAVTTSGVLQCNLINSVGNLKNITKVAFSYKLNSFSVSVNGSAILKDTLGTVPLLLSRIKIGGDSVNSIPTILSGKVNLVKLYKTALTDSELISLTTL
jgi:hypothetical protein